MQNKVNLPLTGDFPAGYARTANQSVTTENVPPALAYAYGLEVTELLSLQPAGKWRKCLMNALRGYLCACLDGDQHGEFEDASDLIELVDFFERIEQAEAPLLQAEA